MLWHSFTKFHTEMHLGWLQGPVDFQGQRSNNYVTRSQDRSNGYRGVKSISILSQYMQSYWFSKQSSINIIYDISVITITITMSIISVNFGKYAISDCPFITCQNFEEICKYVRLTVCLSVCLSVMLTIQVAPFKQSTPNLAHVCILDLATGV